VTGNAQLPNHQPLDANHKLTKSHKCADLLVNSGTTRLALLNAQLVLLLLQLPNVLIQPMPSQLTCLALILNGILNTANGNAQLLDTADGMTKPLLPPSQTHVR
jgi:hypothetical protein